MFTDHSHIAPLYLFMTWKQVGSSTPAANIRKAFAVKQFVTMAQAAVLALTQTQPSLHNPVIVWHMQENVYAALGAARIPVVLDTHARSYCAHSQRDKFYPAAYMPEGSVTRSRQTSC
eukprot:2119593-Amphidinium_carterae.1